MDDGDLVLGLDIGGTQVRVALAQGERIIASHAAVWPPDLSANAEVDFVAGLALDVVRQAGASAALRAVGVSLAALLAPDGTVASWPNRPAWRGLPFKALLEARLGAPATVEDDANAAALAEWTFGAGQGYRDLLVVMAGTGIGAGLILDGRLFRGRHGWAGELGHLVVVPDGPACPCGHRGCLQMVASGRALGRAAAERGLPGPEAVTAAAARGETWAEDLLAACGRWIGLAAANVVNLLDIEAVVVGGGLSGLGAPWWPALEAALQEHVLNPQHRRVMVHRARLPDSAGVLGAVALARQQVAPLKRET